MSRKGNASCDVIVNDVIQQMFKQKFRNSKGFKVKHILNRSFDYFYLQLILDESYFRLQ